MVFTEWMLKWGMRLYPPLLFQRIWVRSISKDFKGISVVVRKSLINKNYNNSIFGGTLFSAADPFYPVLFHALFLRRGYNVIVWLKSAQIQYLKPASTHMHFDIVIDDATIAEAEKMLLAEGKFIRTFEINIFNKQNELCVIVHTEAYARKLDWLPE